MYTGALGLTEPPAELLEPFGGGQTVALGPVGPVAPAAAATPGGIIPPPPTVDRVAVSSDPGGMPQVVVAGSDAPAPKLWPWVLAGVALWAVTR